MLDGTKWIGSQYGGLFRFGRTNWEQYYNINTGDQLKQVDKIRVAPDGEVWFKTIGFSCNKFFKFDGSSFMRMEDSLGLDTVLNFDIAPNGDVYGLLKRENCIATKAKASLWHFYQPILVL